MTDKHQNKTVDPISNVETTGHSWDGITELNTPLPRWWLNIWYMTIAWAIAYMILMTAMPGLPFTDQTNTTGARGHSDRSEVATAISELNNQRRGVSADLMASSRTNRSMMWSHIFSQYLVALATLKQRSEESRPLPSSAHHAMALPAKEILCKVPQTSLTRNGLSGVRSLTCIILFMLPETRTCRLGMTASTKPLSRLSQFMFTPWAEVSRCSDGIHHKSD